MDGRPGLPDQLRARIRIRHYAMCTGRVLPEPALRAAAVAGLLPLSRTASLPAMRPAQHAGHIARFAAGPAPPQKMPNRPLPREIRPEWESIVGCAPRTRIRAALRA
ncbi:hypothetical protein D3C78_1332980 [compost metagenome]